MNKIALTLILTFVFLSGFSMIKSPGLPLLFKKYSMIENRILINADPCLDAALNAQANAFYIEQMGHLFCANSVAGGGIAVSEYGDCCYAFTAIRQMTVAYIQSTFVPCPSGNGVGIAWNNQGKNVLSKA